MKFTIVGGLLSVAAAVGTASASDVACCSFFPPDNIWNVRVDSLPVDPQSDAYIQTIGANTGLHPDFGTFYRGQPIGIPYVVVPWNQPLVDVTFDYDDESDPGPYPIPTNPPIEGGPDSDGDRHILIVQTGADGVPCTLWELFYAFPKGDGSWTAGSGAKWDLSSHALRPDTWTSADAAGLPILPGLVRFDEAMSGEINHAIRFTCNLTRNEHVWPARHNASDSRDPAHPPMGQRFRLKGSVNIDGFAPPVRTILQAMKTYGIILADNGSDWYITGEHDVRWDDDMLVGQLAQIEGCQFEAVDSSSLMIDADSGMAADSSPAADINRDGMVSGADLSFVLGTWGAACNGAEGLDGDLDNDGDVDGADLSTLLGAWTVQ
ncbi:MAG: hypothetical protein SGJ11_17905 [Phycisphaerae bacterium]|mgnify:CR=1 FL=1|nr:hypothetical protein [Phycisphaerae bacterium]